MDKNTDKKISSTYHKLLVLLHLIEMFIILSFIFLVISAFVLNVIVFKVVDKNWLNVFVP